MKHKAQGDDLNAGLETEYSDKVGLCVVLQEERAKRKITCFCAVERRERLLMLGRKTESRIANIG